MNKRIASKSILVIAMICLMLFSYSCSTPPVTEAPGSTAEPDASTPQQTEEEEPDVDRQSEFMKLVDELKPVAAWSCEPDESRDSQIVDAVSGTPATLVNSSVVEGYSGGGIFTAAQQGGYLDVGTGTIGSLCKNKSAITVSIWVMPYNNYNSNNYRLVSLPIDGGKAGFNLHYQSTGIQLSGRSISTEGMVSKTYEYKLENDVLGTMADYSNEGQWQHIVATLDFANNEIILYINGTKQIGTGNPLFVSSTFQAGAPTEADCFGGSPRSDVYSFNGVMDNIFVFDRALSAKEVRQLYTQPGSNHSPIIDELLLQSIIKRMSDMPAFYEGCTNLLYQGMVCPVDPEDLAAAPVSENGNFLIPVAAAERYFPNVGTVSAVTVGERQYLPLAELCEANGRSLLLFEKMAVVMASPTAFQTTEDAALLERMARFFGEPAAATPFSETELSRTIVAQNGDLGTIRHCASPSVVTVGDTIYVSMDSNAKQVYVFASEDDGKSFDFRCRIDNFKFASLFTLNGDLYLLGVEVDGATDRYAAITKSTDGGRTWSQIDENQGRLPQNSDGFAAHASSTAVVIANGRVYKAYSGQGLNGSSFSWRKGCTAFVESAPIDSDLLNPANWTVSSSVSFNTDIYHAHPNASDIPTYVYCQEGNVVPAPDGSIWAIYRVDSVPIPGTAIVMKLSADGKTLTYDRTASDSMISFDGGITKCTIRYDAQSGQYLALVNNVTDIRTWAQRNVLSLAVSDDLIHWRLCKTVLIDRSVMNDYISMTRHGFQYVDWTIDGNDLLFVVREAMGDSENYHNANYLTFYRLENYQELILPEE